MKIRRWLNGLKLNTKFTGLTIVAVAFPIAILAGILFYNMEKNVVAENINSMEYKMQINERQIETCEDAINMSTQFILSDDYMSDMLNMCYQNEEISVNDIIDFQKLDVTNIERLVNNNPLLYAVRIYDINNNIQEMMPIIYSNERMQKLTWASEKSISGWHYNYHDTAFSSLITNQDADLLCLVTPVNDYKNGVIGYIEAAMTMDTMFPSMYEENESEWACFVADDSSVHFSKEAANDSNQMLGLILEKIDITADENGGVDYLRIADRDLIVSYIPCPKIAGTLINVDDITEEIKSVYTMRDIFVLVMIFVLVVISLLINDIVKRILKQFYSILKTIRLVQSGNLDERIEHISNDEMGELSNQLNTMLDRIRKLMNDNINREVLVKNSEIRALQNQINAHFIYNVLESIKMMAEIDEEYEISDAITALGKLLRYSMRWVSGNVKVFEELEYIKNYMVLINLRYDFEVHLSLNIPEPMLEQEIPKMSLQPVVENAILHGIEPLGEESTIYIKGWYEEDDCIIEITDAGKGLTDSELETIRQRIDGEIETTGGKGNGIGLKNVQDRIMMSFGEVYGVTVSTKLDCYTKVALKLPKSKGLQ